MKKGKLKLGVTTLHFLYKLNIWIFVVWYSLHCIAYKQLLFWGWTMQVLFVDSIIHFFSVWSSLLFCKWDSPSFLPIFYCWHLEESNKIGFAFCSETETLSSSSSSLLEFSSRGFYFTLFIYLFLIIIHSVWHFILCVVALFKVVVVQCYREASAVLL